MTHPQHPALRNRLASASLAFSTAGMFLLPFLGSLAGIILGHMATADIRRRPYPLAHDPMARWGLIMGWTGLVAWTAALLFFVFVVVPWAKDLWQTLVDAALLRTNTR